jgi:uncharacterized protein YcbK (DUF882 family)
MLRPDSVAPKVAVALALPLALALLLTFPAAAGATGPGSDSTRARADAAASAPRPALVDSASHVLGHWLGLSGNLRVIIATPAQVFGLPVLRAFLPFLDEPTPGVHDLPLAGPDGEPLRLLSLIPFGAKQGARLGPYALGWWPQERPRGRGSSYEPPEGFIEVTPENLDLPISKRFRLRDFLTRDQREVWPKYLVLRPGLLDKLELIAEELEAAGRPSTLRVLSGFRSPRANAAGIRPGSLRARDSRHMYGDAADIVVDGNADGRMDDLDGDGRVGVRDARYLRGEVERVESRHPELAGGVGVYRSSRTHGPFVHVDARGSRARW